MNFGFYSKFEKKIKPVILKDNKFVNARLKKTLNSKTQKLGESGMLEIDYGDWNKTNLNLERQWLCEGSKEKRNLKFKAIKNLGKWNVGNGF